VTETPADVHVVEEDAPPEAPAADRYRCYRCDSPHDPFQEYCLECGARLTPLPAGGVWRRDAWTRDSPLWFWATLLALLLIALVTGAVVLAATRGDDESRRGTTAAAPGTSSISLPTTPPPAAAPTTGPAPTTGTTVTFPSPQPPTSIPTFPTTTGGTTFPTTTSGTTTTGTTTGGSTTVISWPANRDGYTVFLRSFPQAAGRAAAEAEARRAIGNGLRQVGVLDSSRYSSLVRGYWVVFYGIHDTEAQASATVTSARTAGYPNAYIRNVQE
jgi:hypothetical protein